MTALARLDEPANPLHPGAVVVARRTRWLRALLVAPVLVFALGASSHLAIRCTITGVLMPESCCPDVSDPTPAPHASVDDAGCCERVTVATARIPAAGPQPLRVGPAQPSISYATPLAALVADRPPPPLHADRRAARPPGSSAPLYVVTHAFLL
jgi:hypothetical protein